ncbi:hypothetical protein M2475_000989 [Breznakia sp. PF5-3]|uniref:hypothetical protein n=1 Tax=unclassified Breznakia TaxID=2623764 RepID=UPI002405A9AF|nr:MULTISPECIES: hypothetical protein [unclassified Breznakia]MDF9825005.1 hypothetical protein [Breznakia sp. PM6-1]MDF9835424.1 hypothetical protein [Breznakia sp. PF5-3]MDF9837656.1 hypothetical protein [Breznakia sp. PFB2-8]MDF9859520.1 hypothetical protein [Breznakia sp. PH5-24]
MNVKKIYYICFGVYVVLLGYAFYSNYTNGYMHSFMMTFVSAALLFVPQLVFKIFKLKPVYEIYIIALIFIAIASLFGSSYRFFDHYLYWDKISHAFSGVLGVLFAYILFCTLKKIHHVEKKDVPLMLIFINAVNISIAALWEQYEYICLLVADYDAINHYTSGVHDSMGDIGVCIIGGVITTLFIVQRYRSGKPNFITNVYEKFYEHNIKNRG